MFGHVPIRCRIHPQIDWTESIHSQLLKIERMEARFIATILILNGIAMLLRISFDQRALFSSKPLVGLFGFVLIAVWLLSDIRKEYPLMKRGKLAGSALVLHGEIECLVDQLLIANFTNLDLLVHQLMPLDLQVFALMLAVLLILDSLLDDVQEF